MAARTHVDNVVSERRLRPIYDYLDNGNNKKALQEAEKVLKKQKNFQCAKVLKALALLRLGKKTESTTLLGEIHNEVPTDDATLQAITICYRELQQLDSIADIYSAAVRKDPHNEELLTHLFMAYVRLGEYKKQQQVAMTLFKLKAKNPYYFWAVMSIVMQAHTSSEEISHKILLPLAERMTEKFAKENRIEAEAEVQLYLLILEMEHKYEAALNVIQGPLGAKLMSFLNFKAIKCAEFLGKMERWSEMNLAYRELIASNPDGWNLYCEYLTSTFKLIDTDLLQENEERRNVVITDRLKVARDFIVSMIKSQSEDDGRAVRSPSLAIIKLACMCRQKMCNFEDALVDLILNYISKFGDRPCCFGDVKPFLCHLTREEAPLLLAGVKNLCGLIEEKPNGVMQFASDVKEMQRHMLYFHLGYHLGAHDQLSVPERELLVSELLQRYRHATKFGTELLVTDVQPNDGFCILAAHILFDIWRGNRDSGTFYFMLVTLEAALTNSASGHQIKLMLIKLYSIIGAAGPCFELYESMDIKHVLQDALGYLVLPNLIAKGHFSQGDLLFGNMLKFFSTNYKDSLDYLIASYKFGSFTKINEFVMFRERLNNSMQYASAVVEHRIRCVVSETCSHQATEQALASLGIDPNEDAQTWNCLRDNRDLDIMVSWASPDKQVSTSTKCLSFDAEVTWIKLRTIVLRCLVAVHGVAKAHTNCNDIKTTHDNCCVSNGFTHHPQDTLCELVKQLREFLHSHKAETYQLPQVAIQEPLQSRIVAHLKGNYSVFLVELLEAFLRISYCDRGNNYEQKEDSDFEKKSCVFRKEILEKIKAHMSRVTVSLNAGGLCSLSGIGTELEDLVNIAELVSFVVVILGFCKQLMLPQKTISSKKEKKKQDDKPRLSTFLDEFKIFLGELQVATTSLHDCIQSLHLESLTSRLRIEEQNLALLEKDSESVLQATSTKIRKSFQKSLSEIGDLLQNKLKYMNSLQLVTNASPHP